MSSRPSRQAHVPINGFSLRVTTGFLFYLRFLDGFTRVTRMSHPDFRQPTDRRSPGKNHKEKVVHNRRVE